MLELAWSLFEQIHRNSTDIYYPQHCPAFAIPSLQCCAWGILIMMIMTFSDVCKYFSFLWFCPLGSWFTTFREECEEKQPFGLEKESTCLSIDNWVFMGVYLHSTFKFLLAEINRLITIHYCLRILLPINILLTTEYSVW